MLEPRPFRLGVALIGCIAIASIGASHVAAADEDERRVSSWLTLDVDNADVFRGLVEENKGAARLADDDTALLVTLGFIGDL